MPGSIASASESRRETGQAPTARRSTASGGPPLAASRDHEQRRARRHACRDVGLEADRDLDGALDPARVGAFRGWLALATARVRRGVPRAPGEGRAASRSSAVRPSAAARAACRRDGRRRCRRTRAHADCRARSRAAFSKSSAASTVDLPLVDQDERLGIADDRLGIAALAARVGLAEGAARERIVAEHRGRAAEELPALDVVRLHGKLVLQLRDDATQVRSRSRCALRQARASPSCWRRNRGRKRPPAVPPRRWPPRCLRAPTPSPARAAAAARRAGQRRPRGGSRRSRRRRSRAIRLLVERRGTCAAAPRARRRTVTRTTAMPQMPKSAGAAQRSQVRGATGGFISTNRRSDPS